MISRYIHQGMTWVDIESPTREEIAHIVDEFTLPELIAEDMFSGTPHAKVDLYNNCMYLILHFPVKKKAEQEIDFIIGEKFLITVHYERNEALTDFAKSLEHHHTASHSRPFAHAGILFADMMKHVYKHSLRDLAAISGVIKRIEHHIFDNREALTVREISETSHMLLDFKQALTFHEHILRSYERVSRKFFNEEYTYYTDIITAECHKVTSVLESNRDILQELQRTNDSLLSTKQNETLKNFTIITFIMVPLTVITGIFGMNTTPDLILIRTARDFYVVVGSIIVTALVMVFFFRKRRWL